MEPIHDSRRPEDAAAEKTAGQGGNSANRPLGSGAEHSGTPRSWRQYIEQTLPAQETAARAEQEIADSRRKMRSRSVWERFTRRTARWAHGSGKKARTAAAVCLEKLGAAAAACREKLDPAAAACREKLGPGVKRFGGRAKKVRAAVARHPVSPLLYVTLLAVVIGVAAFQGNYARAYVLEVNGQKVGLVSGKDEVNAILSSVETRAANLLGGDFDYPVEVSLSPVYAAPGDLTDAAEMEDALFEEVGAYVTAAYTVSEDDVNTLTAWAISVDGEELGRAADKNELYRMLDEIAQPYLPEGAVRYEFMEDVQVCPVEMPLDAEFDDLEPLREELSALRVEEAVYVVKAGDTFNAIAYSLNMDPNDLSVLNPDVIVNQLWVDQELVIQQAVPRLSVIAYTNETYEKIVPSPVEYIETADLYVGDTKVKEQGKDGLAQVTAQVAYINNVEQDREVLESTTLEEPTTTYTYTGTTPRPATASNGYFIWPVWGSITSYFGSRNLWGSYDYHLGLDIGVPYGTGVKAADGGTVIKAGWNGSYGNLVAIRHDNGIITYYAHNSSLLVSVGQKVYQGQVIALAGSTGNSSGPHCHFEVRVNGTSVNPLNYLS